GGMFAGYLVFRSVYVETFRAASVHLDTLRGAVNTAVLLTSSLTVALAVHAAERRDRRRLVMLLLATVALAVVFLAVKATEYYTEYQAQLIPGLRFVWEGEDFLAA